jgi:5-methylcytosine-specific restriction endonuclease McrA
MREPLDKTVRSFVMKRDKGKCQFPACKRRGREIHHILKHSSHPLYRNEPKNLILLCTKCHRAVTKKEIYYMSMFLDIVRENEKRLK